MERDPSQSSSPQSQTESKPLTFTWRVKLAFVLFVVSLGWPLLIPILSLIGVSAQVLAGVSGVMLVGAEVLLVAAAAIAGKEGFQYVRSRVLGTLKAYGPPREVSRARYVVGLVMFTVPILFGWASPYVEHYIPGFHSKFLIYAIGLDLLFLLSLFVLGGGFWDKLRSLFVQKAYVVFPSQTEEKPVND